MTTEGLLNVDSAKQKRERANNIKERRFPVRCRSGLETAPSWSRGSSSSHFKKKRIDNRSNRQDWVFFSSVTQATDCTITGCNAHSAAPNHAPRTASLRRTRHSNIADPAWSNVFSM